MRGAGVAVVGVDAVRQTWRARMLFLKHRPAAPLAELVEYLWLVCDAPAHGWERILPTGTLELVINLKEDQVRIYDQAGACRRFSGMVLSGAYGRPFLIDTAEHALAMGVHFRCGGAFPFTRGTAPGELLDGHVDVRTLWGSGASALREQLCSAGSHGERFRILEHALVTALDGRRADARVAWAASRLARGSEGVREVAASTGLSHRHFVSVFRDALGMTPKLFARVQRFQRALTAARKSAFVGWGALASELGYYDQAHLIREFREFADCTPSELRAGQTHSVKDHHWALSGG
ncbi:MAG: helix-turn-helix domain-containing protein [Myxococcota bacterium]|nr:helix-turn-helix domain-containing protein [Myxococcota bacterium]